jgi:hypothetical protein
VLIVEEWAEIRRLHRAEGSNGPASSCAAATLATAARESRKSPRQGTPCARRWPAPATALRQRRWTASARTRCQSSGGCSSRSSETAKTADRACNQSACWSDARPPAGCGIAQNHPCCTRRTPVITLSKDYLFPAPVSCTGVVGDLRPSATARKSASAPTSSSAGSPSCLPASPRTHAKLRTCLSGRTSLLRNYGGCRFAREMSARRWPAAGRARLGRRHGDRHRQGTHGTGEGNGSDTRETAGQAVV